LPVYDQERDVPTPAIGIEETLSVASLCLPMLDWRQLRFAL
jgi:hypothetical protein